LTDIHWIGGDPNKGEVYGYVAWLSEKAIIMLRNPPSATKSFQVNISSAFELPRNLTNNYHFYNAKADIKELFAQGKSFKGYFATL